MFNKSELEKENVGLKTLLKREERTGKINDKLFALEEDIRHHEDDIEKTQVERENIKYEMDNNMYENEEEIQVLQEKLKAKTLHLEQANADLVVKGYERKMLEEDLELEMEVKPSMIYFTQSSREKCDKLETEITNVSEEKAALEDFIEVLREDRQRIESEILRQAMLSTSLDKDISNHRPSISAPSIPPPSLPSSTPRGQGRVSDSDGEYD